MPNARFSLFGGALGCAGAASLLPFSLPFFSLLRSRVIPECAVSRERSRSTFFRSHFRLSGRTSAFAVRAQLFRSLGFAQDLRYGPPLLRSRVRPSFSHSRAALFRRLAADNFFRNCATLFRRSGSMDFAHGFAALFTKQFHLFRRHRIPIVGNHLTKSFRLRGSALFKCNSAAPLGRYGDFLLQSGRAALFGRTTSHSLSRAFAVLLRSFCGGSMTRDRRSFFRRPIQHVLFIGRSNLSGGLSAMFFGFFRAPFKLTLRPLFRGRIGDLFLPGFFLFLAALLGRTPIDDAFAAVRTVCEPEALCTKSCNPAALGILPAVAHAGFDNFDKRLNPGLAQRRKPTRSIILARRALCFHQMPLKSLFSRGCRVTYVSHGLRPGTAQGVNSPVRQLQD